MSQTVEGVIRTVFSPKEGTNQPWNVFLEDDEKRYSTFKKDIIEPIKPGVRGKLTFSEVQKGEYTNYYIEDFEPMKTLDRELTDRGPNGAAPNYRQPTHPDEQASIHRAVALQRAHEWLPYLENPGMKDVLALAEEELKWLEGK